MSKPNTNARLQLAVNAALSQAQIARARMGLLGGQGIDNKRPQAWCEYGFPECIGFDDFYALYRRGGIAHGAIGKIISACWKTNPWVIEGDDQDNARDETPWERGNKQVFTPKFWRSVAEADKRRLVGRYSGLLLQVRDSGRWDEPIKRKGSMLVKMIPTWAGSLKPAGFNTNAQDEGYGQVTKWQYTEHGMNGNAGRQVDIHPDRVFILGDASCDAIGFLEPAYNAFVSLEKVEGGSGESFLKNASRQLSVNYDKEVDLSSIAQAYGVSLEQLQARFNEAAREVNRGNDALLVTQGAAVSPLVTAVADPAPTYNVNLQTAGAALDIPTKILVGMQTGERASSEDQKYFNARCQSRRADLGMEIHDLVEHLTRIGVINSTSEYAVMWDDLTEATQADKLGNAKVMSEINQTAQASGAEVFTADEIREAAGYDALGDTEPLPDEDDDGQITDPAE
ncbi:DUF1073 domain-containing protein [Achromobacter xylosoxidans]